MTEELELESRDSQASFVGEPSRGDGWPEAFERRESNRQRLPATAELVVNGDRVPAEVENSSPSGVFVRAETDLAPGQRVSLVEADETREMEVIHVRPVPRSLTGCCLAGAGLRPHDPTAS